MNSSKRTHKKSKTLVAKYVQRNVKKGFFRSRPDIAFSALKHFNTECFKALKAMS